jgi:hypothetical protein
MVEGLLTAATECERSLADLYSVMMQVGSPELQRCESQVAVSLETSSGRYRAIAYELAVRAGIIENYQLTRFGGFGELGEFLGVLSMDDDSAVLGLAENFSEFDHAKNGDLDRIISREGLEELLDSDNKFLAGIARYYLDNPSAWQRVDTAGDGQTVIRADGFLPVADVRALAGQIESYFRQLADGQVVRVPIPEGYLTGLMDEYDYDDSDIGFKNVVGPTIEMLSDSVNVVTDFVVDQVSKIDLPFLNGDCFGAQGTVCATIVWGRMTIGWDPDSGWHAEIERGNGLAAFAGIGVGPYKNVAPNPDDAGVRYELFGSAALEPLGGTYSWVWGRDETIPDGEAGLSLKTGAGFKLGGGSVRWDRIVG